MIKQIAMFNPYKMIINAYVNIKEMYNDNGKGNYDYLVNLFMMLPNIQEEWKMKAFALLAYIYYKKDNIYDMRCLHLKMKNKFKQINNIDLINIHYKYIQCLYKRKLYSCALNEYHLLKKNIDSNAMLNENKMKEIICLGDTIKNDYIAYNKSVKEKIIKLNKSGFIKRLFDKSTQDQNSESDTKQFYIINKNWYEQTKSLLLTFNNNDTSSIEFSEINNMIFLSNKPTLINPFNKTANAKHLLFDKNINDNYMIVNSFTYSYLKYIFTSTNDISIPNKKIDNDTISNKMYIKLLLLNTELKQQSKFHIKPTYVCFDITLSLENFISKLIHKHLKGQTNYFVYTYKLVPQLNKITKKQILFDIMYSYISDTIEHYTLYNKRYLHKVSNNTMLENKGWYIIEISTNNEKDPFIQLETSPQSQIHCKECLRDIETYDKYTSEIMKTDMNFHNEHICSFHKEMHFWMNRDLFIKNLIEIEPYDLYIKNKYIINNDKSINQFYSNFIRIIIQCDLLSKYFILKRDEHEYYFKVDLNMVNFINHYRSILTQIYTNNNKSSPIKEIIPINLENISNDLEISLNNKKYYLLSICDLFNDLLISLSNTLNYVPYYPFGKHKKHQSIIEDLFSFQFTTQVLCTTCSSLISTRFFTGKALNLTLPSNKKQIRLKLKIFPCESYNFAETDFLLDKSDYIVIKHIKAQIKGTDAYEILLFNPSLSKLIKLTDDDVLFIGNDPYCKSIDLSKEEILIYCTSPEHPIETYAYFYILPFIFLSTPINEDDEPLEQIVFYPALFHAGRNQQVKALAEKISVFYMSRVQEIYIKRTKSMREETPLNESEKDEEEENGEEQQITQEEDTKKTPNFSKQTIEEFVRDTMENNINLVFYALHDKENIQIFSQFKVQTHATIQNEYQNNMITLNDLIAYSNNENLQLREIECIKCKRNKTSITINYQTQFAITKEPLYLLITIKRFYINKISLDVEKNEIDVQYEEEFKFGKKRYMLNGLILHDGEYENGRYRNIYQIVKNDNEIVWVNGDNNNDIQNSVYYPNAVVLLYKQIRDKKKK